MPLMVDLRPRLTVAHSVQVFLHRLFHVVEIRRVEGQVNNFQSKYLFYRWIFCLFARSLSFFRFAVLEGESTSCAEFFIIINGFSFLLPVVFFGIQLWYYSTRDSTLTRVMSRGMKYIIYNTLLIILI